MPHGAKCPVWRKALQRNMLRVLRTKGTGQSATYAFCMHTTCCVARMPNHNMLCFGCLARGLHCSLPSLARNTNNVKGYNMADAQLQTGAVEQTIAKQQAQQAVQCVLAAFAGSVHCTVTKTDSAEATICVWPRFAPDAETRKYNADQARCAGWYLAGWAHGHIYTVE
jgi:hypothetical protein